MLFLVGAVIAAYGLLGADWTVFAGAMGVQAVFVVYFLRHMLFAISAMQTVPDDRAAAPVLLGRIPRLTVLVACKDEVSVVDGLVDAMLKLDYPADRLQMIIVNDSSTDGTGEALARLAEEHSALTVVHRADDDLPGKPAALNMALGIVTGEIILVFDADHRPRPDVAKRLVRHFDDPRVAAAQGRCVIRNGDDALLARMIAVDYSAGYLVNEYGRQAICRLPAYGGANCAVRASALRAVGGWNPHSVAEDTDLTLRLTLAGHVVRYDVTAVDEEEGVVTLRRYWKQRYRWARGHQEVSRDYRRAVLSSRRFGFFQKVEAMLFLFVFHVPIATSIAVVLAVLWFAGVAAPLDPLATFVLWTLLFLGPLLELGAGLLLGHHERRDARLLAYFLPLFFVTAALCTKAWFDVILGREYTWVRTSRSAADTPPDPESVERLAA